MATPCGSTRIVKEPVAVKSFTSPHRSWAVAEELPKPMEAKVVVMAVALPAELL